MVELIIVGLANYRNNQYKAKFDDALGWVFSFKLGSDNWTRIWQRKYLISTFVQIVLKIIQIIFLRFLLLFLKPAKDHAGLVWVPRGADAEGMIWWQITPKVVFPLYCLSLRFCSYDVCFLWGLPLIYHSELSYSY